MRSVNKKGEFKTILKIVLIMSLISIMTIFTSSCKFTIGVVSGSGNIETEERDVSDFDEVHLSGIGNLIIEQGDKESLIIEAEDNIIPLIKSEVSGDRLTIGFKRGFNFIPTKNIKLYLMVIDLDSISLSGAGDIDCDKFDTDKLELEISGTGDIDFNIVAEGIEIK